MRSCNRKHFSHLSERWDREFNNGESSDISRRTATLVVNDLQIIDTSLE